VPPELSPWKKSGYEGGRSSHEMTGCLSMTYPSRGGRHYFQTDPDACSPQFKRRQPLTLKACCMFSGPNVDQG
jgi:hypothetical protein